MRWNMNVDQKMVHFIDWDIFLNTHYLLVRIEYRRHRNGEVDDRLERGFPDECFYFLGSYIYFY